MNTGTTPLLELYRRMLLLRRTEEALASAYKRQEMRTPTHFGIGQEAVAVGICAGLNEGDVVYSHHRAHNHYLARGGGIRALAAELFGRETGCSGGRGGSVHLTAREVGFVASSAILGQTIPVAVGSALSFKMDGLPNVAVTFFGEAACEEGIIYESFNFASIRKLPVLFTCENNLYSTESPLSVRQPSDTDLCARARSFGIEALRVDGNDVTAVNAAAQVAIARARAGNGPTFLECMTYRWLEHVGPYYDHELGRDYRSEAELREWMAKCPLDTCSRALLSDGICDEAALHEMDHDLKAEIAREIAIAKDDPWPATSDLMNHVH